LIEENSGEVRNDLFGLNIWWNLNILREPLKGGGQLNRLLKNAHLLRFPHPSLLRRTLSTPHSSGFQEPNIWAFLSSLKNHFLSELSI
jgi:hypothetical protein